MKKSGQKILDAAQCNAHMLMQTRRLAIAPTLETPNARKFIRLSTSACRASKTADGYLPGATSVASTPFSIRR